MLARTIGPYELIRPLGRGGMGEVFLARRRGPAGFERMVAVKVVPDELSGPEADHSGARLLREGRALASLHHRGIVQVLELGIDNRRVYLAMEYLRGVTLRALREAAGGRLPWPMATYVALELARALEALHGLRSVDAPRGLLHGDLSPSNAMACEDGAVKLVDFGLARPSGAERSATGLAGKLAYLPPESLAGAPLDPRADVYALGVVLYELLTGVLPFRADNELALVGRVLHDKVTPPSTLVELPLTLERVVLSALSRDLRARPPSAHDLASSLEQVLGSRFGAPELARWLEHLHHGETLAGGRSSTSGRAPRRDSRIRLGILAVGFSLALGTLLVGVVEWRARKLERSSASPPEARATPPTPPTPPTVSTVSTATATTQTPAPPLAATSRSRSKAKRRGPSESAGRAQPPPAPMTDPALSPGFLADPFPPMREAAK